MTRPAKRITGFIAGIAVLALLSWGIREYHRPPKWNVLLVTLDTTRADRIGCYGYQPALTPAMDGLAARGALFERAYASAPLTLPSHATILTGLYPPEHGLHTNGQNSLGDQIPTLAEILRRQGYETGAFLAAFVLNSKFGLARGFDKYDDQFSGPQQAGDRLHSNRPGDEVVDSALQWLKDGGQKPFYCWVHLYDPHFPYLPHADVFADRFSDQPYDAEIAFVDMQVKRLLDFLKSRSLDRRTLVIVVGDHGEGLGDHGERTHGNMLYDSCLHVPLIFAQPNSDSVSRRIAEPVSLVDVFPSILDCLGILPPQPISGRTLKPALHGQTVAGRACYSETEEPFHAARCSPLQCVITERWKYIRTPRKELFDLRQDPRELENQTSTQPEQMQALETMLADLEHRMTVYVSPQAGLSSAEERALASLGYVGGQADPAAVERQGSLSDTKDMLPYFNLCDDALKEMTFKRYDQAEAILKPVVAAAPSYFEARCSLGVCYYKQRRFNEAETEFQEALERGASPATVNIQLGLTRMMLENYAAASENFSASLRLKPDAVEVHYYLGTALKKLGRLDEAIGEFEQALDLDPDYAAARSALSNADAEQAVPDISHP